MADKCIGRLTLNTKGVDDAIKHINEELKKLGVGEKVNISSKVTAAVKESLKDIETLLANTEKKIAETAAKANQSIENIGKAKTDNTSQIKKLAQAYKELYDIQRKAETAKQQKNQDNVAYYQGLAGAIQQKINKQLQEIEASGKSASAMAKEAQAMQSVINAKRNLAAAQNTTTNKAQKEEAKEIEDATKAYIKLLDAKSKVKQLEAEGKQDSEEYLKATQSAGKAYDAFIQYSKGARDAAMASREAAQARKDLNAVEEKVVEDTSKVDYLAKIKQQYFEITDAIKNYNAAKKAGDDDGMAVAQSRINAAMQEVSAIQEAVNASNLEAGAKQQILNYIQQCTTAERQHTAEINKSVSTTSELESQVQGLVTRYLSLMAVIRSISSLMQNMIEYVTQYSDKMNEIQMITLKSNDEVSQLADKYRDIAKEMNASSLDIADAAIYFTRQGLETEQIEDRLRNVTKYAKAANVEFKDAAEIVTAVVNSMGILDNALGDGRTAAERVADVFLKIGDNAATSGQEIGEAMQKAAASAGAFGVSMEWLASYIATVSETTRQEARTIGTAFNTIIARLHQIKQTGYNQEDETKVNDIAKALSNIDIALMDQSNNWRDMEDILVDIAEKWDGLDDKTKSYIATTMAGVKQQNVFLALMNDMSKGAENGSRAFELYGKAIDSAGTATEKYDVYLDSVTAAQERLTIAQEQFYSILDEGVIKGWYNALAGFVGMLAEGADTWGSWTIVVPVVIGLVTALGVVTKGFNVSLFTTEALLTALEKHPIMAAISAAIIAIGALVTLINYVASAIETSEEKLARIDKTISESQSKVAKYNTTLDQFGKMMEDVGEDSKMTSDEISKYNDLLNEIALLSPAAASAVENLKNNIGDQAEAFATVNEELERFIKNEQIIQAIELSKKAGVSKEATGSDKLAEMLLEYGDFSSMGGMDRYGVVNALPDNIKTFIQDLISKQFSWDQIDKLVSQQFLEGMDASEYLTKTANALIDEYIDVIGMTMNQVDKSAVRSMLAGLIFGDDGILDFTEYQNMGNVLKDFVDNAMATAFNPAEIMGMKERLMVIGESIFGNFFDMIFGDQIEEFLNDHNADIMLDSISEAISDLMAAGFSDVDIGDLLRNLDLREWANAIEQMKKKLMDEIAKNAGVDGIGILTQDLVTGEEYYDMGMWEDLDVSLLKYINDLVLAGVSYLDIQKAMDESEGSVENFKAKLEELNAEQQNTADSGDNVVDYFEKISKAQKEIDQLTEYITAIKSGQGIDFDDLLNLTKAHPEILSTIGDLDALKQKLEEIRGASQGKQKGDITELMLDSEALFKSRQMGNSKLALSSGAKTFRDYLKVLEDNGYSKEFIDATKEGIESLVDEYIKLTQAEGEASNKFKETLEGLKEYQTQIKELDGYIEKLRTGQGLSAGDLLNITASHQELSSFINDLPTLKTKLEELRGETRDKQVKAISEALMENSDFFAGSKFAEGNDFTNMKDYMASLQNGSKEYVEASQYIEQASQNLVDGAEALNNAADTWLEAQSKIISADQDAQWAKTNGYEDQINGLITSLQEGGAESALATFNTYLTDNKDIVTGMASEYPNLIERLAEVESAQKNYNDAVAQYGEDSKEAQEAMSKLENSTRGMDNELKKAQKYLNTKYFKDTAKAAKDLSEGTISVDDAYEQLNKELNNVTKAYEDVDDVTKKLDKNADVTVSDVSNLAKVLGMSAEDILADWPAAVDMFNSLTSSTGEFQDAINALNDAAFIRITGTSDADFSAIEAGLISVQNLADDAVAKLQATGQWTTETIDLPQNAAVWHPGENGGGYWTTETMTAGATVLKPTGNNPFSGGGRGGSSRGKGGGGGGGGGGGSKSNSKSGMTKVERMLDRMSQVNDIQNYQKSYYEAQEKYYNQTGQLQGVIAYKEREMEVINEQNKSLEANIAEIEKWIDKKTKELSKLKTTSSKYETVASDLDKLQKAHQQYTLELVNNTTALEQLEEEIDETRKKIRQMEIDLRNTILKAIEDREAKTQSMLKSEIEMENIILELIKKRYEKERDDIIRTTDLKIEALEQEKDLLEEQLRIRREQAEEEDKAAKLKELEVQYQRIIADPTRAKEAQKLKQEIDDLREEMAWDLAEKEVKAQQESIDQQITSLEDYEEYINNYYEDLFEHPQKLIEEMREVIMMSQDEIIAWLKEMDEEYQNSSENTQRMMVQEWEQTYKDMKGILTLYWDEVEQIIAQGDDYIIQFLKENSADYAKAGKLQAEAYVDEWKEQLKDLKKAHEKVVADIAASYKTIEKAKSSASSSSGGSSGGGGGGTTKPTTTSSHTPYYTVSVNGTENRFTSRADAEAYANKMKSTFGPMASTMVGAVQGPFALGGLAKGTGLAWLDGTQQDPERILSPYQTKLFESMVQALESMSRISVPSMSNYASLQTTGTNGVNVGDIIVNVDNLDTDEDYEEMADKVCEILMDRIGQTAAIGGLRIRSV